MVGFRLVPEYGGRDIILQGEVTPAATPAKILDGHFQVFLKADRVLDMPAVQAKPLGYIIMPVSPYHLAKPGIGAAEFRIVAFFHSGRIFLPGIEIIGAAEIIFRTSAADGREFGVAINIEFY